MILYTEVPVTEVGYDGLDTWFVWGKQEVRTEFCGRNLLQRGKL